MVKTIDEVNKYIVYIEGVGYLADKQGGNKLNFTDDYEYAKTYKTKTNAIRIIKQTKENTLYRSKRGYVQPIKIKQISEYILERMQDVKVEIEEVNNIIFTESKLNVEVVVVGEDDEFWN